MSEAREVFIPRQAPEQKLVSVPMCVSSLPVTPVLLHGLCYIPLPSPTYTRGFFRHFKEKMAERNTLSPQCDTATADGADGTGADGTGCSHLPTSEEKHKETLKS